MAGLYDGFSILTMLWLEALGFCGAGRERRLRRRGHPHLARGRAPDQHQRRTAVGRSSARLGVSSTRCASSCGTRPESVRSQTPVSPRSHWVHCPTSDACCCGRATGERPPAGPARRRLLVPAQRRRRRSPLSLWFGRARSGGAGRRTDGSWSPRSTTIRRPGAATEELVRVVDVGVVRSWTWVAEPGPEHPRDRRFAFALVELDGADTALLHVVDVARRGTSGDRHAGASGLAAGASRKHPGHPGVRAGRQRGGAATEGSTAGFRPNHPGRAAEVDLRRTSWRTATSRASSPPGSSSSLAATTDPGGRCPSCGRIYVPPRPRCPACRDRAR